MASPNPDHATSSARRILPLGVAFGVILLVPLAYVLLNREDLAPNGDYGAMAVYVVAAFSATLAFGIFILVFLWGAEYADESEEDTYHERHPDREVR